MLPTIVFMLALAGSVAWVNGTIVQIVYKINADRIHAVVTVCTTLLWGWLYYLSH